MHLGQTAHLRMTVDSQWVINQTNERFSLSDRRYIFLLGCASSLYPFQARDIAHALVAFFCPPKQGSQASR